MALHYFDLAPSNSGGIRACFNGQSATSKTSSPNDNTLGAVYTVKSRSLSCFKTRSPLMACVCMSRKYHVHIISVRPTRQACDLHATVSATNFIVVRIVPFRCKLGCKTLVRLRMHTFWLTLEYWIVFSGTYESPHFHPCRDRDSRHIQFLTRRLERNYMISLRDRMMVQK